MSLGASLRSLLGSSLVYGAGSVLLRALAFLLLPLYTRHLTPADYGLVAVTLSIISILSVIFPLGLHSAMTRMWFASPSEAERRRTTETIWLAIMMSALALALLLDVFGSHVVPMVFRGVAFSPYIRFAIWTAFLATFSLVPLNLLQIRERPGPYVILTVAGTLVTTTLVVVLVVIRNEGAYGYLLGGLIGGAVLVPVYLGITLRNIRLALEWGVLHKALLYSLPLVPHALAGWMLEVSDRAVLARWVSLGDLGIYSLGYQFGAALGLVITAFTAAWVPFLFRTLADRGGEAHPLVARLATYYAAVLCFIGLGIALLIRQVLILLVDPAFHGAYRITPWVVGGYLFNGLYIIPVGFLFWTERTKVIPVVTLTAGLLNVGLNLWLVPIYGIMGAAWTTMISYGVMAVLVWIIAQRVYPFPYEWTRMLRLVGVALALFVLAEVWPTSTPGADMTARVVLWLAYPLVLIAVGFLEPGERAAAMAFTRRAAARVG
ncbi:MAG: oligosaccharide flippase family protein [Gemmatimonadales bacterium]